MLTNTRTKHKEPFDTNTSTSTEYWRQASPHMHLIMRAQLWLSSNSSRSSGGSSSTSMMPLYVYECVCVNVFGWVNGGNTAAEQQTKRMNVYKPYYARYSFSFSLPTSFSNGSLYDDRPVSIRSSKRSQRISVVPNWAQFKLGISNVHPFLQTFGLNILKRWVFLTNFHRKLISANQTQLMVE